MPTCIAHCARLLAEHGLRHHVDEEEDAVRVVFVTDSYRNLRGERLLIVTVETPDEGERLRARIRFAFPSGEDPARTCLLACSLAADSPFVGVEYDEEEADLRLVAEMPVVDGSATGRQLLALIDGLVAAAERWQQVFEPRFSQLPLKRRNRGAA